MQDLISRQAAIEALEQIRYALWGIDIPHSTVPEYIEHHRGVQSVMKKIDDIRRKVESLPSADVRENKRGKWVMDRLVTTTGGTYGVRRCSECESYYQDIGYGWNYCPDCGAEMEESTASNATSDGDNRTTKKSVNTTEV